MPIAISFPPCVHDSARNSETGINDLQPVLRAEEAPVIDVRPERYIAGCSLVVLGWCREARPEVVDATKNTENDNEEEYFLHGLRAFVD